MTFASLFSLTGPQRILKNKEASGPGSLQAPKSTSVSTARADAKVQLLSQGQNCCYAPTSILEQ